MPFPGHLCIEIYYGSTCPERPCLIILKDPILLKISAGIKLFDCIFVTHSHSQIHTWHLFVIDPSSIIWLFKEKRVVIGFRRRLAHKECLLEPNRQQCHSSFILNGGVWLCHGINPISVFGKHIFSWGYGDQHNGKGSLCCQSQQLWRKQHILSPSLIFVYRC